MPAALRVLLAVLLAVSACGGTGKDPKPAAGCSLRPGSIVKATSQTFSTTLRCMQGMPLVVNYWASWCGPCAEEMPILVEAAERYEGTVRFLGVNVEDATDSARSFAKKYAVPFASLADPTGDIRRDQRILGLPATQFYRSDGQLAFHHYREIKRDDLETKLVELIRVSSPGPKP